MRQIRFVDWVRQMVGFLAVVGAAYYYEGGQSLPCHLPTIGLIR